MLAKQQILRYKKKTHEGKHLPQEENIYLKSKESRRFIFQITSEHLYINTVPKVDMFNNRIEILCIF